MVIGNLHLLFHVLFIAYSEHSIIIPLTVFSFVGWDTISPKIINVKIPHADEKHP